MIGRLITLGNSPSRRAINAAWLQKIGTAIANTDLETQAFNTDLQIIQIQQCQDAKLRTYGPQLPPNSTPITLLVCPG